MTPARPRVTAVIVPDTKDWTWVLERPCPECGFDASTCAVAEIPALIRENGRAWRARLDDGRIGAGRADEASWSSLEYACHVRDVYRRYRERTRLMLDEDDPLFENWDQDASAVADRYDEQDPSHVMNDLEAAAEALAADLDRVTGAAWERPGRRSDGASFTVATLARYMVHDPIHHLWDVDEARA
jgi:hypothetical protein